MLIFESPSSLLIALWLGWSGLTWMATAEDPIRFELEILAMEASDRTNPPPSGAIVLAGSSSFRLWKTLATDLTGYPVVNRGFGGSHLSDLIFYAKRIVLPLRPRLIFVYEGDNDLASGKTPYSVFEEFRAFADLVHRKLARTRVVFVAVKPSPQRRHLLEAQNDLNRLIRERAGSDPQRLGYVDVVLPMLTATGEPRGDLFLKDRLHLNAAGYALWTRAIREYLSANPL